jgi:hypothetical protein
VSGAFGVSAVRAVMKVLDIAGESVSQASTALVLRRRRSHATSTPLVVRTNLRPKLYDEITYQIIYHNN